MKPSRTIKPYDITRGEKVSYGYYSALEVVFQKFLNKLETFMYDEFKLVFSFDFEISTDHRFSDFQKLLTQPTPIFIFNLNPLLRDSILKTDNRFINLILSKQILFKERKVALHNRFSQENSQREEVQETLKKVLELFESCWEKVHQVRCGLKGVVSNRIKAKVMDSTESCVLVSLTMRQNNFTSKWDFCFSTYQLERIIEKRGSKGLLAASGVQNHDRLIREFFNKLLIDQSSYELKGVLGSMQLTSKDLIQSYRNKSIIPISSSVRNNAEIHLNNAPVLAAEIGETTGRISLKVMDKYSNVASDNQKSPKSFSRLTFNKG